MRPLDREQIGVMMLCTSGVGVIGLLRGHVKKMYAPCKSKFKEVKCSQIWYVYSPILLL